MAWSGLGHEISRDARLDFIIGSRLSWFWSSSGRGSWSCIAVRARDWYMGLRLYPIFVEAGLPGPVMHLDAAVAGGLNWVGHEYMGSLIAMLLPRLV